MVLSPYVVAFDQTLAEAHRLMGEHAVRHLPVMRDGHPVGLLSQRDITAVLGVSGQNACHVHVAEAMTPVPYAVPPGMPLQRVVRMMAQHHYGCAVVTDDATERVLGVFTITDALNVLAELLDGR